MKRTLMLMCTFIQSSPSRLPSAEDSFNLCLLSRTSWEHRWVMKKRMFQTKNGSEWRNWIHVCLNKAGEFTAGIKHTWYSQACFITATKYIYIYIYIFFPFVSRHCLLYHCPHGLQPCPFSPLPFLAHPSLISLARFSSEVSIAVGYNVVDFWVSHLILVTVCLCLCMLSWIRGVERHRAWHLELMRHMMRQGEQR